MSKYFTGYVVANKRGTHFINRPIYSGRVSGAWNGLEDAFLFVSEAAATRCCDNINERTDHGPFARVVPLRIKRAGA